MHDRNWLISEPDTPQANLLLAHGAGASMQSSFLEDFAERLRQKGLRIIRFNFPYMTRALAEGKRKPPDRMPTLLASFEEALAVAQKAFAGPLPWFLGGKSMGGRVATMFSDQAHVAGAVCLGYPFHPPGKPDKLRTAHLEAIRTPTLICQGTRDKLGSREEVLSYKLSSAVRLCWLEDGDHDLKPRVKSGRTHDENLTEAVEAILAFLAAVTAAPG